MYFPSKGPTLDWSDVPAHIKVAGDVIGGIGTPIALPGEWLCVDLFRRYGINLNNELQLHAVAEAVLDVGLGIYDNIWLSQNIGLSGYERGFVQHALQHAWAHCYLILCDIMHPNARQGQPTQPFWHITGIDETKLPWVALRPSDRKVGMFQGWETIPWSNADPEAAAIFAVDPTFTGHPGSRPFQAFCRAVAWQMLGSTMEVLTFIQGYSNFSEIVHRFTTHVEMVLYTVLPQAYRDIAEAA
jgi:hypothetical protein